MAEAPAAGVAADAQRFPWERPLGARPVDAERVEFRVWAPHAERVALALGDRDLGRQADAPSRRGRDREIPLGHEGHGVYATVQPATPGSDYRFVLDGTPLPDPASRWQPGGLRGPSRVFAPATPQPLARPVALSELVVYELHIGTFSAEGTFLGAIAHLDALAELGVNAIEVMPVAEFPGARGWGYDGVYISAAQSSYGGPAALVALIAAAHERGIAVILDVVYNHVGASGTGALEAYGPYFTAKYETPWGRAMNYDDALCDPVREWVLQSAEGWIGDYGIDGLRLDAIHAIHDSSAEHIVAAVARRVHALSPHALVILESGLGDPKVVRSRAAGGWGADAVWADDFHHALRTLITDEREGYYEEFGRVELLAKAMHRPHVHDGGYSSFRRRRFGARADDVAPERFVVFCQDHDQVGNRAFGDRLPPEARPLAAFLTLLSPFTPMLFMGEEYGEPAPFQFFCDHIDEEIAQATRNGRRAEFAAFASFGEEIPDPQSPETFANSKLTRERDPELATLYAQLLELRRELPPGEAGPIAHDEGARWLRVRRGPYELLASFAAAPVELEVEAGAELVLVTHPVARPSATRLSLAPLAGALLRSSPV
jgi:maltooligosyltrehalose trehalohydrolase